jgi:hypothetical protein
MYEAAAEQAREREHELLVTHVRGASARAPA